MTDIEIWRDIPGYEGRYAVSTLGRVKSLRRYVNVGGGGKRLVQERILKPGGRKTAYKNKSLQGHQTVAIGKHNSISVSVLVATTFLGPRIRGAEVCHIDGDYLNNRLENLRYGTKSENMHDILLHGRRSIRLGDIVRLRILAELGLKKGELTALAKTLGISLPLAHGIITNRIYANVSA